MYWRWVYILLKKRRKQNMLIEYDYAESYNYEGIHPEPKRQHWNDAGADLTTVSNHILSPKEIWLAPTGIKIKVPDGYVGLIFSRSGLAKHGITLANSVGVIDAGYRGEIKVPLINHGTKDYAIEKGSRIAQIVFIPCLLAGFTLSDLDDTERGEGGFGHTGQ